MKRKVKQWLSAAMTLAMVSVSLMLAPVVHAANTTYYVDAAAGSDSNNGTSTSTPWKSIAKLNTVTFGAGDQILFKCGTTTTGAFLPKGSGTASAPVVIGKYGTGANPILDGAGVHATLQLDNNQYYEISDIEIMNNTTAKNAQRIGLYLTAKDAGTLNHIYVNNVYFHDIVSTAPNYTPGSNESAGSFTGGIVGYISGTATPTRYNDVKITNCRFDRCDRNVFYFFYSPWYNNSAVGMAGGAGAMFNSTNVVFSNNIANDTPGTGMCLCACDGAVLSNNVMNNCQSNVASNIAGVAASTWASRNCIYKNNEIYHTNGTADGQGMDNDGGCSDCIFEYNYSRSNYGGFYLSCSGSDCKAVNGIFRYNISQNDRSGIFDHRASSTGTQIYNNTVYNDASNSTNMFRTDTDSTYGTATFSNNIFVNLGTAYAANRGSYTWQSNTFYGNFSSTPADTGKQTSNPMLTDPGKAAAGMSSTTGYALQAGSPCIASGVAVSGNGGYDYAGVALRTGTPDRGAYQYNGTLPSPTPTPVPTPTPSGVNVALNKTATANAYVSGETPAMAVDGSVTGNSKWCASTGVGAQWLQVDLGTAVTVKRWVVRHAGAGGEAAGYNTRDFKLQKSTDGTTWTDADSVTGNTANVTDRTLTAFTARYVRLYITNPQTTTTNKAARIYEFEVYN